MRGIRGFGQKRVFWGYFRVKLWVILGVIQFKNGVKMVFFKRYFVYL